MKSVEVELSEKDKEIQTMKHKYEEMNSILQNILNVLSNVNQTFFSALVIVQSSLYFDYYDRSEDYPSKSFPRIL